MAGPLNASHHPTQKSVRISTQGKQFEVQQPGSSQSQVSQSLQNEAVNFNYEIVQLRQRSIATQQSMLVNINKLRLKVFSELHLMWLK